VEQGKKGNKGEKEKRRKAESRRRKAEGRRQKAESRKRKAESGKRKAESRKRGGGGTVTGKRIVEQGTKGTREKAGGSSSAGTVAEL